MNGSFDHDRHQLLNLFASIQQGNAQIIDEYTLQLFRFQYKYNKIYHEFCNNLGVKENSVTKKEKIPFLPISAFKIHDVKTGKFTPEDIFRSSGTTAKVTSRHHVRDTNHYLLNAENIWSGYFRPIQNYQILALLPGYLEREGSSLIKMVDYFVKLSPYKTSGFYLRDFDALAEKLILSKKQHIPTILFGVTYALLDFIAIHEIVFPELTIIETGGMKGNREEKTKVAVHKLLKDAFQVKDVYSEYGMTELLSQAYTKGETIFLPNEMLHVFTHQANDPLTPEKEGKPGIISIIDLANIDSCAFIQTEDLGIRYIDGSFEILGRLDYADIRGCNLLVQESGLG